MSRFPTPSDGPLRGLKAVTLAGNIPGPVAVASLVRDGVSVVKVEAPSGDMVAMANADLYEELTQGLKVETIDLRTPEGQQEVQDLLREADLLVSSQRPSALARLGITAESLAALNPELCWVEIVGDTEAPEIPGHDLTYQLQAGLLTPPQMPRTLLADLSGAQEAARAATTLLLGRARGSAERHRQVGLRQSAEVYTLPLRHGLTSQGGWLSGAQPIYRLYPLKDGWVGVAAVEPHFAKRMGTLLAGRSPDDMFAGMTTEECNRFAHDNDLPLHAIPNSA